ncbi:hypothetical protein MLD38_019989 [Melastoma candidum]|uniref:Uncharacterized protein n=1 Tax=Melastoma candidum TaxID=119954 RepID=A0ACB9QBR5_9MYRT|nr:hypothetical protein MLD38_019989 [Melastoma candidum]
MRPVPPDKVHPPSHAPIRREQFGAEEQFGSMWCFVSGRWIVELRTGQVCKLWLPSSERAQGGGGRLPTPSPPLHHPLPRQRHPYLAVA